MPECVDRCVICGCQKFFSVERYKPRQDMLEYVACAQCGLVFMNPRPTEKELAEYYADSFWQEGKIGAQIQKQRRIALSIKRYIALKAPALLLRHALFILEVGSSFGVTLSALGNVISEKGGVVELFAIEPSAHAVSQGAEYYRGVTMLGEDIHTLNGCQSPFDLVIFSHVLEHFPNPIEALRLIASKISLSGLLYIEVPNFYSHPSVSYAHNYCFTETSLRNSLSAARLKPISLDLLYRNPRIPKYLTCLACKDDAGTREIRAEVLDDILGQRIRGLVGNCGPQIVGGPKDGSGNWQIRIGSGLKQMILDGDVKC